MAKPSIFSRDYERAIKKRRKRIVVIIIGIIFIIGIIAYISLSGKKNLNIINKFTKKTIAKKTDKKNTKSEKINEDKKKEENSKNESKKKVEDKCLSLQLNENLNIKITYEEKEDKKIYKEVVNSKDNSNVYYDISPSKTALIVLDENTQKIFFIDNASNINDISKEQYVSKKGKVFSRENKIKNNTNYIWCETPRFIDENNIAFISQLPWLSENDNKFIWFGNVQEKKYRYIKEKQGTNVEFQNLSENGLVVSIDKKIYYIKADGQLTQ